MASLPSGLRVGAITDGEYTPEQAAAYEWAAEAGATVTPVRLADLAADDAVTGPASRADEAFDVLWWHRDRPLAWLGGDRPADEAIPHPPPESATDGDDGGREADSEVSRADGDTAGPPTPHPVAAAAETVRSYLAAGGGLLLTLHGLSAVTPLGIDPTPPDATGHETRPGPSGYLAKAIHADHPAFEGFDVEADPAIYTRAADADTAFARYESVMPAHGDVLAGGVRGDEHLVGEKPLVEWRVGPADRGRVVGAGASLSFGKPRDYEAAAGGELLVANLLSVLGGDRRPTFDGRPTTAEGLTALRRTLADDHHRPRYHLSAPANWLNDPNGLIQYDGRYHVFYQYNPGGPYHGTIHWGHAVSEDLVTWRDEPVALVPDPDGPDRDGCWSGCAVVDDDGTPTLLYTGGRDRRQLPCLATAADDSLRAWNKDPRNPIIPEAPAELDVLETPDWEAEFRDHNVFRQDGAWYQVIGSGLSAGGGTALLYRGESLDDWTFVGQLLTGESPAEGNVWECPELLELGERQLLHVSVGDRVVYFLGEADLSTPGFEVTDRGLLDHGNFYAPQSLRTDDGRVLTWGWLPPARDVHAQWDAGWSGTLSLPRELAFEEGRLRQRPAREVAARRETPLVDTGGRGGSPDPDPDDGEGGSEGRPDGVRLAAGEAYTLDPPSNAYELRLRADREPGARLDVVTFETPARTERTTLTWTDERLVLDRSASSLDPRTDASDLAMPLTAADDHLSLRLFVDGSVLTAFAGAGDCLTGRVYPTRTDATGVRLLAREGAVAVDLEGWTLGRAFPDVE
jgi:beta-fructofuranosidase